MIFIPTHRCHTKLPFAVPQAIPPLVAVLIIWKRTANKTIGEKSSNQLHVLKIKMFQLKFPPTMSSVCARQTSMLSTISVSSTPPSPPHHHQPNILPNNAGNIAMNIHDIFLHSPGPTLVSSIAHILSESQHNR